MFNLFDENDSLYTHGEIAEAVVTNELKKLNYEFEMCMIEHSKNLQDIEVRLIMENGTEDDAYQLYLAEAAETKAKSEGILTRMLNAVKKILKSIKEFFVGKKEDDVPQQVTMPEDPEALTKEVNGFCAKVKAFFSGDKSKKEEILAAAGVTGVAAAGLTYAGVKISKKINQSQQDLEKLTDKAISDIKSGKVPLEDEPVIKKICNTSKSYCSRLLNCTKSLFSHDKSGKPDKPYPGGAASFIDEVADINEKLTEYSARLKKNFKNKHNSWKGKIKGENSGIKEFKDLENIPEYQRTPEQVKRYNKLLNKYGAKASQMDYDQKACDQLVQRIDAAIKENNNAMSEARRNKDYMYKKETKNIIKHIREEYRSIKKKCDAILPTD